MRRAILKLSGADVDMVRHNVDVAQQDYRDVLCWADNPPHPDEPKTYEELLRRRGQPPEESEQ